jgi:uncharacterized protein YdhG (YjbR/CyaY superfamily)
LRATIKASAPEAKERISYQIPTFYLKGIFITFCRLQKPHWVLSNLKRDWAFKHDLAIYPGAKGTVRFPLNKPLPLELIGRIVKFRVAENLIKVETKPRQIN